MMKWFGEIKKYRDLLYMITWREIKIKYKQSVMGFMWAIFMPILIICAGIFVKFAMSKLSGKPFTLSEVSSVSVKALPWSFFISCIRFATNSLTTNVNLITKIYFPRELFPISAVLSQLFDFMIASSVLIIILTVAQVGASIYLLWVPALLVVLIVFATALGIFLSAANLFYRDVKYLVEVVVTFGIFFTPVFYESELAGRWEWLLLLNPVAPLLEGLNSCIVLGRMPKPGWVLYSGIVSLMSFFLAMAFFKKLESKFAENI
jgi:ABC-type polysaccharide/polyol phosphate export permease